MPLITTSNAEFIIQDLILEALNLQGELKQREIVEWVKAKYLKRVKDETLSRYSNEIESNR